LRILTATHDAITTIPTNSKPRKDPAAIPMMEGRLSCPFCSPPTSKLSKMEDGWGPTEVEMLGSEGVGVAPSTDSAEN